MGILVHNKGVLVKFSNYEQEINTHPWSQLFMEAGIGHNAVSAADS